MIARTVRGTALSLLASASLVLGACSADFQKDSQEKVDTASKVSAPSATVTNEDVSSPVTFSNAYVKAKPADKNMTAIFGELTNVSDKEIHIVSFSTSLNAKRNEIHEVVNGQMRQREGGITLAPGEAHMLQPGGDHLMIMDFAQSIAAGDTVDVVLHFEDGASSTIKNVPVRSVNSGEENYGSNGDLKSDTGMDDNHGEKHDHNNG